MDGIESIAAERKRQIEQEGWTAEHDDQWSTGEIAVAAAEYATHASYDDGTRKRWPHGLPTQYWPRDPKWWKPSDRRRDLVKAGALIAAEIDRLDRASKPPR